MRVNERDLCIVVSGYSRAYPGSANNERTKNKCVAEARQCDWSNSFHCEVFLACGLAVREMFRTQPTRFPDMRQTANSSCDLPPCPKLRCLLRCGAIEPLLKMRRCEARFLPGGKALILQLCSKVEGVDVGGHLSWVPHCTQETPGEIVHSDWFGAGNLDD